jgi:hypothetical protein
MKPLIWKECRENLKWAALPMLLILGPMGMFGAFPLLERSLLFYAGLVAALFGAALGFLQVFLESQGDKRSILLHRPLSRSRIFLGKAVAGVGLYLLALGIPFACVVGLAATPGHVDEPFSWPMALPWLADVLTGLVYYFAGMLTAQREARWYGSRCLGLAAGLGCSYLVWVLPDFWHALLAILTLGALAAVAAWGSFLAGGAYAPQPRLAKIALAATLLTGLSALSFTGKAFVGAWQGITEYYYWLDRQGRVLVVHNHQGRIQSITDLEGLVPLEAQGKWLDEHVLKELRGPAAVTLDRSGPQTRSYRNPGQFLVEFGNDSKPGSEKWCYAPDRGRLFGYDRYTKQLVGSFGPEGFCPPNEQPRDQFRGELLSSFSIFYLCWADDYLVFADRVYAVNFRNRTVQTLFLAPAGETVLWASRLRHEKPEVKLAGVATDRSVRVLDPGGAEVFSAPWAYNRERYHLTSVTRMEGPLRYRVQYQPRWYLEPETLETLPGYVVEYDATGREAARYTLPARPQITGYFLKPLLALAEPSYRQVPFGLVTSPAEDAVLVGATRQLFSEFRASRGTEMWLLLQFLAQTTTFFIPGAGWNMRVESGLVLGHAALMLLSAAACALSCFLLARRYSFSGVRCSRWALAGFLFGWAGLLLMLVLQEWPARIACPSCRRPRRVDRDLCEHCCAPHAVPAPDGTEVFETTEADGAPRDPVYQAATVKGAPPPGFF